MNTRNANCRSLSLILLLLMPFMNSVAQGSPYTVGPVTLTIPRGWTAKSVLGQRERYFSADSTLDQFFALGASSSETTDDLVTRHSTIVNNLSGILAPGTTPQSGTLGRFLFTRLVIVRPIPQAKPETLILYSTKVGSTYVGIDVDATNDDLLAKNLPAVEAMIRSAVVKNAKPVSNGSPVAPQPSEVPANGQALGANTMGPQSTSGLPAGTMQMPTGPASLDEYVYAVPPGWSPKRFPDGITIFSQMSSTREQCQITLWPMKPSSGDVMKDAALGFQQVFTGFEPRSQTSYGPLDSWIIRGISGAGWSYAIIKQGIGRRGYESMYGAVMAAKLNNSVAIVSTISKDPLVSTCLGESIADAWPDFFYSLGFRSWGTSTDGGSVMKQALLGTWTVASSTVADQFTFTANGRYGGASASQHYNLAANDTVIATTQAFFGDGTYTVQGNSIMLTPDDRNRPKTPGRFRVQQESKDGGRTWQPILYLQRISSVDGKEYEVRYRRTGN